MSAQPKPTLRFLHTAAPLAVIALGGMGLATAQSSSPFASQKKKQAWEVTQPQPQPRPAPQTTPYTPPQTIAPQIAPQSVPPQPAPSGQIIRTAPHSAPAPYRSGSSVPPTGAPVPPVTDYSYTPPAAAPAQNWGTPAPAAPAYPPKTQVRQSYQNQGYQNQNYQAQGNPYPPQPTPQSAPQSGPFSGPFAGQNAPRSWKDRLGLSNLATVFRGKAILGAAASYRDQPPNQVGPNDGWSEDFIGDAEVEFEVSAITDGGLEYGLALGGRAQYDPYRRGFGGRLPDCPPSAAGCSGNAQFLADPLAQSLRGHTSQFYTVGDNTAKDVQGQLETAHLFLRSAYGDVTVGRDDGAAYLFSLGAPSLLAVGASNSGVDFTGYDSVKTVNDASGFSEKVTYTSPRLLGDSIGVGVQLGVSYALDADACGVDYCTDRDIAGVIRPEIEDVLEIGLALDRTFQNGLSVEATGTYARGSEGSGLAGLDDLESFGAGLELGWADFTLGGSWLQSNNGVLDGDYTSYDAGITWKPGDLGFTLGYGHATDDNVGLTSDQAVFGVTYDFDKFTLGTGVQYVDRSVNGQVGGLPTTLDQTATSLFVQGGFKF